MNDDEINDNEDHNDVDDDGNKHFNFDKFHLSFGGGFFLSFSFVWSSLLFMLSI